MVYLDTIDETQIVREQHIDGQYCCAELSGPCNRAIDHSQERHWHYLMIVDKGELIHNGDNGIIVKCGPRSIINISINTKMTLLSCSSNFHGYIAGIEFNHLLDFFHREQNFPNIFRHRFRDTVTIKDEESRRFRIFAKDFQNLMGTLGNHEHHLPEALNYTSFHVMMIDLADIMWNIEPELMRRQSTLKHNDSLLISFMESAAKNIDKHSHVEFYANLLCVSKSYLSQIIKQKTGVSIGVVLATFRYERAIKYVNDRTLSLQQIADRMSFPDLATFSKFFRRHNGSSPLAYRKKSLYLENNYNIERNI